MSADERLEAAAKAVDWGYRIESEAHALLIARAAIAAFQAGAPEVGVWHDERLGMRGNLDTDVIAPGNYVLTPKVNP